VQQEFDNKFIFTNIDFLRYMLSMSPDQVSGLEIKINGSPEKIKANLQQALGNNFVVETRYEQNKNLYAVMQMEKWVIYGILSLILIVAAFNMIGALTMLVLEKQKDIAVLKAMGSSTGLIQKIFITEGLVLAGVGTAIGTALGTIICILQLKFKIITLGGAGSFIIDYYPVKLMATDYLLVVATITVIALLAAWIPAKKASQQLMSLKS
jgi:lipoprotein-releasing system permease protein